MIIPMVYVNANLEPVILKKGKIYDIPENWARKMLEEQIGAEYRRIK
jgi:hypothetical protein